MTPRPVTAYIGSCLSSFKPSSNVEVAQFANFQQCGAVLYNFQTTCINKWRRRGKRLARSWIPMLTTGNQTLWLQRAGSSSALLPLIKLIWSADCLLVLVFFCTIKIPGWNNREHEQKGSLTMDLTANTWVGSTRDQVADPHRWSYRQANKMGKPALTKGW